MVFKYSRPTTATEQRQAELGAGTTGGASMISSPKSWLTATESRR